MTATFPPVVRHFMLKAGLDFKEPEAPFFTDSIRNYIKYGEADDFDYDFIIEKSQGKKALVICNTVKSAQHVYGKLMEKLGDNNALHLLHSEFTRKDRRMLEKAIMEAEEPCIWVTTQIVEASLDIDFDILFTDLAPVDRLVQRMGRCYRRREYSVGEPNVYIYNLMDAKHKGKNTIYDEFILKRSAEALRKYGGILSEKDKAELVNSVYDAEALRESNRESNFYKSVEDGISELKNILSDIYSAEKAEKKFRNIQSVAVIPDNIYDANIDDIDSLIDIIRNEESSLYEKKHAEEQLFDMTVSVNFMKYRKIIESPKVLNYGNSKMFYRINGMDYDFDDCSLRGSGLIPKITDSEDECFL
ncbi:MAG: CRISPR-associated helicase Cas3' [bacterium]|nr:CRISPR-associated helicase Cas3' [bacterium]